MGTRNLTIVNLDKKTRVAQYGQWDGYPTGQGQTIADFLKTIDLPKFKKELKKLREVIEGEIDFVNNTKDWQKEHPELSPDTGAGILEMIQDGKVKFVSLDEDFKNDSLFCEYYYTLNLDKETISVNGGKEYTFKQWTRTGLMEKLEENTTE